MLYRLYNGTCDNVATCDSGIKEVVYYRTEDGRTFESREEAERHEAVMKAIKRLKAAAHANDFIIDDDAALWLLTYFDEMKPETFDSYTIQKV